MKNCCGVVAGGKVCYLSHLPVLYCPEGVLFVPPGCVLFVPLGVLYCHPIRIEYKEYMD